MTAAVKTLVEGFLTRQPTPEPPPLFPASMLESATFNQEAADGLHFAVGDRYVDMPPLLPDEVEEFDRIVRSWAKRREFPGTSLEGIRKRLSRVFVDCLNAPDDVAALVAALIHGLQQEPVVDVLLPICGVDLRVPKWSIAPDVRLVRMAAERFDADVVEAYVRGAAGHLPIGISDQTYGAAMAAAIRNALVGSVVLVVRAVGDEIVAQDRAQTRASDVVDVLQFAAALSQHSNARTFIEWSGDEPKSGWRVVAQIPISGDVRPNSPGSLRGPIAEWRVDDEQIARIVTNRVDAVFNAALAQEKDERQDMILRAVQAFANAERQWSPHGKKLSYTTVFDIFFSLPGGETTKAVREGVAFALWSIEGSDQRFELAKFINAVYDSRSRTSHEFETGRFGREDLERLRVTASRLIEVMSQRESFTKQQLAEDLESERTSMGKTYSRFKMLERPSDDEPAAEIA